MSGEATHELTVEIGGQLVAFDPRIVLEVIQLETPSRLPFLPSHILGMLLWRDRILPVVDLLQLLEERPDGVGRPLRRFERGLVVRAGEIDAIVGCDAVLGTDERRAILSDTADERPTSGPPTVGEENVTSDEGRSSLSLDLVALLERSAELG